MLTESGNLHDQKGRQGIYVVSAIGIHIHYTRPLLATVELQLWDVSLSGDVLLVKVGC